jgi:hypothetical protein
VVAERQGNTGFSVGNSGNGFYSNVCTGNPNQPFSPVEAPMGSGNTFSNICYSNTNLATLPPSTCRSYGGRAQGAGQAWPAQPPVILRCPALVPRSGRRGATA